MFFILLHVWASFGNLPAPHPAPSHSACRHWCFSGQFLQELCLLSAGLWVFSPQDFSSSQETLSRRKLDSSDWVGSD
jgi:hypothetical protein